MEGFVEQLNLLKTSENPLHILSNMQRNLPLLSKDGIPFCSALPPLIFQPLFSLLNCNDREQILICVELLSHILTNISSDDAYEQLQHEYIKCLNHPEENVKLLIIKQLLMDCSNSTSVILRKKPLLASLVKCLSDKSMDVVKNASKCIVELCTQHEGIQSIFCSEHLSLFTNVMNTSDSARFNVHDLVVKVSLTSEYAMLHLASLGLITNLLDEISSGDVLTQLNSLELLSDLILTPYGLRYLEEAGVLAKMSYLLCQSRDDSMAAVLLPGVLKFFGHLGSVQPYLLAEGNTTVLSDIMKISSNFGTGSEIPLQLIAFETLAHISVTLEGKHTLLKYASEMQDTLRSMASHIKGLSTEFQVRVLDALAQIFYVQKEHQNDDIVGHLEVWFDQMFDDSSMKNFFDVARQPFPQILSSCLKVMKSLAGLRWGVRKITEEPGLLEWLLDRNSCSDKSSKELRWDVITILSQGNALAENIISKLSKFSEEGPFYVETELSVAFEGE